jgi:hypothetical protein
MLATSGRRESRKNCIELRLLYWILAALLLLITVWLMIPCDEKAPYARKGPDSG